jgi:hypothetical protein
MVFNKILVFYLLSFANEVTCKQGKKGQRGSATASSDQRGSEIEAWTRLMQSSSMITRAPVTKTPTKKPVVPPTNPPTRCIGTPDDLLKILSKVSDPTLLVADGTAQNKAFNFMKVDNFYCTNDPKIIQRYVMALTYFSTGGEGWTNCGAFSSTSACDPAICKDNNQGNGVNRWLDSGSECDWCGNQCNTTNNCMTVIDLDSINQSGTIPFELQELMILETLAFQRGNIKGGIPSQLGNIKTLQNLDLNFNNITGTIPGSIYGIPALEQLDLNDNNLVGTVSTKIGDLKNLSFLQLGNDSPSGKNRFTGTIPSAIGELKDLTVLTTNNNDFVGSLPSLSKLTKLGFLDVSGNALTGPIDTTDWAALSRLRYADFSDNLFDGTIPSSFAPQDSLEFGAFDGNNFSGSMPQAICNNRNTATPPGMLVNLTSDCLGSPPQVACSCCTGCF